MPKPPLKIENVIDSIKRNKTIIDNELGCWLYTGSLDKDGYPERIQINYRRIRVTRLSAHFYLNLDLDDENHQALHKTICPNRSCWNPEHLYIGTVSENMMDRTITKTHWESQKVICSKGHPYNEENTYLNNGKRQCKICRAEYKKMIRGH